MESPRKTFKEATLQLLQKGEVTEEEVTQFYQKWSSRLKKLTGLEPPTVEKLSLESKLTMVAYALHLQQRLLNDGEEFPEIKLFSSGKRKRESEFVLIYVYHDSGSDMYVVPVDVLQQLSTDGMDVLELLKEQNGWHCEDAGYHKKMAEYDYINFLLGGYPLDEIRESWEKRPDILPSLKKEHEGILKKYKVKDTDSSSSPPLPTGVTYFSARNECCI